jgi:NADH-quinone oxidoreductase subunit D
MDGKLEDKKDSFGDIVSINMGPQHPSTHGVLRVVLDLDGEVVVDARPDIGFLHRGVEKLAENRTYHQFIPLTDRLDYLASLSNNLAYCLAVEKFFNVKIPERANHLRVIFAELSRISSHLLWLGTHALDIGAMTVFLYTFREREMLLDLFEMATGQRMTSSWVRVGGIRDDVPPEFIEKTKEFTSIFDEKIEDYRGLLSKNRIWLNRTKGIGRLSKEDALSYGVSGPIMRASGIKYDVRKFEPYCGYEKFDFDIPCFEEGDVYARYLVRMEEMRQSCRIVRQAISSLPEGPIMTDDVRVSLPAHREVYTRMESLIRRFYLISKGFRPPEGEVYASIESTKGELGFFIVSDGTEKPYRLKIRAPSFVNLGALPEMSKGYMVADIVSIIGSIDIVLGEIDR